MDYKRLPKTTVAVLVFGLRDDSRLRMKYEKRASGRDILLGIIADRITALTAALTGAKMGDPIARKLAGLEPEEKKTNVMPFENSDDFYEARYGKGGTPWQRAQH